MVVEKGQRLACFARGPAALHSFEMPPWINLPNLFTLVRLALAPFVMQAVLGGRPVTAFVLFALAAFTDYLDGAAARRLATATQAGAYLDPIADKCLLSGTFLALAPPTRCRGGWSRWFLGAISSFSSVWCCWCF